MRQRAVAHPFHDVSDKMTAQINRAKLRVRQKNRSPPFFAALKKIETGTGRPDLRGWQLWLMA